MKDGEKYFFKFKFNFILRSKLFSLEMMILVKENIKYCIILEKLNNYQILILRKKKTIM